MGETGLRNELHANGQNLARQAVQILEHFKALEIGPDEQMDLSNLAASLGKAVMELVVNAKVSVKQSKTQKLCPRLSPTLNTRTKPAIICLRV
jgi:hypothetical protein